MFAYTKLMQAMVESGTVSDTYFNRVTLLLNTSSTNGAQNNTFLDSSTANAGSGWTITRNGNTTQGTFTPFSQTGWSSYFSGNNDYVLQNSTSNWNFLHNGSSWTIEFSLYHSSTALTVLTSTANASAQVGFSLQLNGVVANDVTVAFFRGVNGSAISFSSTANLVINTWNQVGITFDGTTKTCTFYINGVQRGSSSNTGFAYSSSNSAYGLYIGTEASSLLYDFTGYLSNYRISNTVRTGMTSTLTQPFTSDSNTSLLLFQSNRFFDAGNNSYTITTGGTPSVQAFSPFAPTAAYSTTTVGGSGYFDGTGDYLSVTDNAALEPAGNNFCIEMSYYPTSVTGTKTLIGKRVTPATDYGFVVLTSGTSVLVYISSANSSYDIVNGVNIGTLNINQWHHIAIYRITNAWYASFNGTITTLNASNSSSVNNNAGAWGIGADSNGAAPIQGYMANTRFVIGSSVYTSISAPFPTSPLTAIPNTQLLLNFTNAGIYDAAAKNDLETVGNAQVSTTQAKFGTTSMYFDGTGDWLVGPRSWSVAANENFTVEGWFYFGATVSTTRMILSDYNSGTPGASKYFSVNATGVELQFGNVAATVVTSTTSFSINTWYHIAAVRNNNTVSIYVNGTAQSVTNSTQSNAFLDQGTILYVGRWGGTTTYEWIGYMDELRFTKGVARYTSNFSVPTAAFPVQ